LDPFQADCSPLERQLEREIVAIPAEKATSGRGSGGEQGFGANRGILFAFFDVRNR
jgi:hypothetical protein